MAAKEEEEDGKEKERVLGSAAAAVFDSSDTSVGVMMRRFGRGTGAGDEEGEVAAGGGRLEEDEE